MGLNWLRRKCLSSAEGVGKALERRQADETLLWDQAAAKAIDFIFNVHPEQAGWTLDSKMEHTEKHLADETKEKMLNPAVMLGADADKRTEQKYTLQSAALKGLMESESIARKPVRDHMQPDHASMAVRLNLNNQSKDYTAKTPFQVLQMFEATKTSFSKGMPKSLVDCYKLVLGKWRSPCCSPDDCPMSVL